MLFLSLFDEPILITASFLFVITSVFNLLFSVVYLLYLPKKILFVKTKNKKKNLFIVTWLELSVLFCMRGSFPLKNFLQESFQDIISNMAQHDREL